jgi:peptidoglycan lytic transglycosylase A
MSFGPPTIKRLALHVTVSAIVAACAQPPQREVESKAKEPAVDVTAPSPGTPAPAEPATPAPTDTATPAPAPFSTRYAYFAPARWDELPGWRDDDLRQAWQAFRRTCDALRSKAGWETPCSLATGVSGDAVAIRRFFEGEFFLYQIRNAERSPAGTITGYYEPLLAGSRSYGAPYIYPIHATPEDLLYLDIRLLPANRRDAAVPARIEGRKVVPVIDPAGASKAPYSLDVGAAQPDIRDKKLRLRLDGKRIVPYYTRAEIERQGLPAARVLVWTNDPAALYAMQIQGSGKIKLPSGDIVRLAYAEQNGQPFTPTVATQSGPPRTVRTRSLTGEIVLDDQAEDPPGTEPVLTRGIRLDPEISTPDSAPSPKTRSIAKGESAAEVEAVIATLLAGKPSPPPQRPTGKAPPVTKPASSAGATSSSAAATQAPPSNSPPPPWPPAISSDPSYVFFREIPDSENGPIGALGIPLTAGRSLAVDPRTTPLGFPVFVATTQPGKKGNLNRLMLAQDTGGAIRGAVRADYFWGFGNTARSEASRMKESARMWLLIPKGQPIAAVEVNRRTRSLNGAASAEVECVVADAELCVEDRDN